MKCHICDIDIDSIGHNVPLCTACKKLNRSDLFSKILSILLDIYSANRGFDAVKDKCAQVNTIIENYPLSITPFCTFDPDVHDSDRVAQEYLRNYVISDDHNIVQKHCPIKIDTSNSDGLYEAVALLCRLDIEVGAKELRVRNIVDMILNVEAYGSADPELHSCLQWGETWRHFVLEQLRKKPSTHGPNAALTLVLHSISNIINMRIRSVYPKITSASDDLRKRLDRIFSPLDIQCKTDIVPTISILWSNKKHLSLYPTSSMWISDCVVPLLPKQDYYTSNTMILPRATSAALQNPAERSFYILSCFCPITQTILNKIVSHSDQQKHSEARMKNEDAKLPEFHCPKCSKPCNNYCFDWNAVALFRQNFTGARLTYVLVDVSSSMTSNIHHSIKEDPKSRLSRITQTKEAAKQLLKEIAGHAEELDQAILTTFDEKLHNPALIPLCKATDIAEESNLTRIDAIELSPSSKKTCFYLVLKTLYEILEREPFLYIDLYIFSDGIDTSNKKNDKTYQAIIRGLNEKIGAKCHFMNCGSESEGFSVAAWLGDSEADCPISGDINEIKTQVKAAYKKDHIKNPNLTSATNRCQETTLNSPLSLPNTYMTDAEAASVRKPHSKETLSSDSILQNSKTFDDYTGEFPSATARVRSATASNNQPNSSGVLNILPRRFKR